MGTDGPKDCAEPLLPTEACSTSTGSLCSALLQNGPYSKQRRGAGEPVDAHHRLQVLGSFPKEGNEAMVDPAKF